jgi:hypothetical protein
VAVEALECLHDQVAFRVIEDLSVAVLDLLCGAVAVLMGPESSGAMSTA